MFILPLAVHADSPDNNIWRKPKFFLQFDKYNSIVGKRGADVTGIKAGLEFGKKYRIGWGYYDLRSDIIEVIHLPPEQAAEAPADSVKARLKMNYFPLCFEYIFYNKGKWQFGFPVNLGFGKTYFEYYDKNNKIKNFKDQTVMVTDVVVSGQYRILKWVGVGAGFGFRKMLIDNPDVSRNFDSPLYNLRVKLFLGEIFNTVFPHGLRKKK